jgi:hypothetical protein
MSASGSRGTEAFDGSQQDREAGWAATWSSALSLADNRTTRGQTRPCAGLRDVGHVWWMLSWARAKPASPTRPHWSVPGVLSTVSRWRTQCHVDDSAAVARGASVEVLTSRPDGCLQVPGRDVRRGHSALCSRRRSDALETMQTTSLAKPRPSSEPPPSRSLPPSAPSRFEHTSVDNRGYRLP